LDSNIFLSTPLQCDFRNPFLRVLLLGRRLVASQSTRNSVVKHPVLI
jgi:hypothetical protein